MPSFRKEEKKKERKKKKARPGHSSSSCAPALSCPVQLYMLPWLWAMFLRLFLPQLYCVIFQISPFLWCKHMMRIARSVFCVQKTPFKFHFFWSNDSSVQSLDQLGRRGDMRDDSVEILFQSFLQEALVSSSGMGRDVHTLMLSIWHFLCRPRRRPPSKVPWGMVLEKLSSLWHACTMQVSSHDSYRVTAVTLNKAVANRSYGQLDHFSVTSNAANFFFFF